MTCCGNNGCACKPRELGAKLELFDKHAAAALDEIRDWLDNHPDELLVIARGRHVEGHYRFGDKGLFEYGHMELKAEASQELADAIVYLARRRHLNGL